MKDVLVDTDGFNQYYEELNRLKDISLSIASIGSESYVDAVGDGWHDNFAFEDTMRESRKIASRINKMLEDEKYLKKIFLSGIETTLKAKNDKELENRIKNFSNF